MARGWFSKAESDLADARRSVGSAGPYDTACFHCQQACEKYLKGFLAFHDQSFPFTHDLERLTKLCEAIGPSLKLSTPEVIGLTDYGVKLRYDNEFWPTQSESADAVAVAERVGDVILGLMPEHTRP